MVLNVLRVCAGRMRTDRFTCTLSFSHLGLKKRRMYRHISYFQVPGDWDGGGGLVHRWGCNVMLLFVKKCGSSLQGVIESLPPQKKSSEFTITAIHDTQE